MLDTAEQAHDPNANGSTLKAEIIASATSDSNALASAITPKYNLAAVAEELLPYVTVSEYPRKTPSSAVTNIAVVEVEEPSEHVPKFELWQRCGPAQRAFFLGLCPFAVPTVSLQVTR